MNELERARATAEAKKVVDFAHDPQNPRTRYKKAIANRTLLMGDSHNGVDWATFNLVLSAADFSKCDNHLESLNQFWIFLSPYLKHVVLDWQLIGQNYWIAQEDADKLMKSNAELITNTKWLEKFIATKLLKKEYQEWRKEFDNADN